MCSHDVTEEHQSEVDRPSPFHQSNLELGHSPDATWFRRGAALSFRSLSLLQAVTSRDEGSVKALLSEGADVNARNNSGQTPLILAIVSGQDHLLRLLLEAGANPLLRDHTQLNAIDWAERKGRSDLPQILRTTQPRNSSIRNL